MKAYRQWLDDDEHDEERSGWSPIAPGKVNLTQRLVRATAARGFTGPPERLSGSGPGPLPHAAAWPVASTSTPADDRLDDPFGMHLCVCGSGAEELDAVDAADCSTDDADTALSEDERTIDEAEEEVDEDVDACASCTATTADISSTAASELAVARVPPKRSGEGPMATKKRRRTRAAKRRDRKECLRALPGMKKHSTGRRAKKKRGTKASHPRKVVTCVTRYRVDRSEVAVGQQPDVANKQTDRDFALNDLDVVYIVEWDMRAVPDRMVIINNDTGDVVTDTGMVSGTGRQVIVGPANIHVRVIPNDGTSNPTLADTVYRFTIVKVGQRVEETRTCYWRGFPIGRRVRAVNFVADADYSDKVVHVTRRRARQILRKE